MLKKATLKPAPFQPQNGAPKAQAKLAEVVSQVKAHEPKERKVIKKALSPEQVQDVLSLIKIKQDLLKVNNGEQSLNETELPDEN